MWNDYFIHVKCKVLSVVQQGATSASGQINSVCDSAQIHIIPESQCFLKGTCTFSSNYTMCIILSMRIYRLLLISKHINQFLKKSVWS